MKSKALILIVAVALASSGLAAAADCSTIVSRLAANRATLVNHVNSASFTFQETQTDLFAISDWYTTDVGKVISSESATGLHGQVVNASSSLQLWIDEDTRLIEKSNGEWQTLSTELSQCLRTP